MSGDGGLDTLYGQLGNDWIAGGRRVNGDNDGFADILFGNQGEDRFEYDRAFRRRIVNGATIVEQFNRDQPQDLENGEAITDSF